MFFNINIYIINVGYYVEVVIGKCSISFNIMRCLFYYKVCGVEIIFVYVIDLVRKIFKFSVKYCNVNVEVIIYMIFNIYFIVSSSNIVRCCKIVICVNCCLSVFDIIKVICIEEFIN